MKDLGGPAYPVVAGSYVHEGMTLLDYFAGQALAGMLASNPDSVDWGDSFKAAKAYDLAEAMIVEKAKREAGE